jgi:hypothetical protein
MTPTASDEEQMEKAVRDLLVPLERELERWNNWVCGFLLLVAIPGSIWGLMVGLEWPWWAAVPVGIVGPFLVFCLLVPLYIGIASHRARAEFDRRFPEGSRERPLALQMLCEMQRPSKAELRLQKVLKVGRYA